MPGEADARGPMAFRGQGGPTAVGVVVTPGDPGGAPVGAGSPDPSNGTAAVPAAVVERSPAPGVGRLPVPAIVSPEPLAAVAIRAPGRADGDHAGLPAPSVGFDHHPVAVGGERFVEDVVGGGLGDDDLLGGRLGELGRCRSGRVAGLGLAVHRGRGSGERGSRDSGGSASDGRGEVVGQEDVGRRGGQFNGSVGEGVGRVGGSVDDDLLDGSPHHQRLGGLLEEGVDDRGSEAEIGEVDDLVGVEGEGFLDGVNVVDDDRGIDGGLGESDRVLGGRWQLRGRLGGGEDGCGRGGGTGDRNGRVRGGGPGGSRVGSAGGWEGSGRLGWIGGGGRVGGLRSRGCLARYRVASRHKEGADRGKEQVLHGTEG